MDYTDIIKYLLAIPIAVSTVLSIIKKDKKDNIWIKVLKNNKNIKLCINEYNKIEYPEGTWVDLARFLPIIFSAIIFLFIAFENKYYLNIFVFFILFILTVYIANKIQNEKEDISLLKDSKKLATFLIFINFFVFNSTIFTIGNIYTSYSFSHQELFIWNEIPRNDNEKLMNFLTQNYHDDWIKTAKIEKIDEKTINVFNGTNSILLRLNDDRTIVNLTIKDGIFEEFDAKMENHKLSIYPHLSITQFLYDKLTFIFVSILFLAGIIFVSVMSRKSLLFHSKVLLNSKHHINFPYVHIKTNSIELKGKVYDIFDENLIILENYGEVVIKAIKWDSIKYLELIPFR